jgi:UDP-glucose 4-epimerase
MMAQTDPRNDSRHEDTELHDVADVQTDRPNVIVTGSGGMIGREVCSRLAEMGYFVFGFDRVGFPEPPKGRFVRDVEFDVTDYSNVRWAIEDVRKARGNKLASVIQLAAYYDFSGEDSPLYDKVTVQGTDRLLNHLQSFELEQFLFSSTMLVHRPAKPGERINEDWPLEGTWAYPQSKIKTERLITEGHPQVNSVLLRIAGVYTDWGEQPTLAQQIKRIYEKDLLQGHMFPGDADAGQALVHLDDCVDAIVAAVERRHQIPPKTPILIGEPDPPSYRQLQEMIAEHLHGRDWATVEIPEWFARAGAWALEKAGNVVGQEAFIKPFMIDRADDHYALDIARARELLGWTPSHRLQDELPKILEKLKADPAAWYRKNGFEWKE